MADELSAKNSKARHRGSHPADRSLFASEQLPRLCTAVFELSWLLERGYSETAALTLVGNRHELRTRQRQAVQRCACGESTRSSRMARKLGPDKLAGRRVAIDGFNCVITLEAAMSGGAVLVGRDSAHRDMSSVHGSYRRVEETRQAVADVAAWLASCRVESVLWLLDRPVSNSGRLKALIEAAAPPELPWTVELAYNPDRELRGNQNAVIASSDSWVLDGCDSWIDIPAAVIAKNVPRPWILDLGRDPQLTE